MLSLFFRILASYAIFYFVSKWAKSMLAGILAAVFFGVCTATMQTTIRVTLFQIYIAIIFLCLFLDKWLSFHNSPNKRTLIISIVFFLLAVLSHPIRMAGLVFLITLGELYWLFKGGFNKFLKIRIGHFLLLLFCIYLLIFVVGSLSSTEELTSKIISPKILLVSIFTGYPPIINSFFLFVANLIISPFSFNYGHLNISLFKDITAYLPILGLLFSLICLRLKRFLLSFISISAIIFPYFIHRSAANLEGWQTEWVIVTQLGGTIFILLNLIVLYYWEKNKSLAQVGLLGSAIVLSNLILPWMVTPQSSLLDQSPFLFVHRYYTIPSVGMGMLLASVFVLSLQSLKLNLNIKLITLFFPIIILFSIYLQSITTKTHLIKESQGINTEKIDLFWVKLRPYTKDFAEQPGPFYVYIEQDGSLNEEYIKKIFPRRVEIQLTQIINPPKINFVFNKDELKNDYNENYFFAFKFDGYNIYDIKSQMENNINFNKQK